VGDDVEEHVARDADLVRDPVVATEPEVEQEADFAVHGGVRIDEGESEPALDVRLEAREVLADRISGEREALLDVQGRRQHQRVAVKDELDVGSDVELGQILWKDLEVA